MITKWQFSVFAIGLWLSISNVASAGKFDEFLKRYCYACHSGESAEAAFDLSVLPIKLDTPALLAKWERVHDRVKSGDMPPKESDSRLYRFEPNSGKAPLPKAMFQRQSIHLISRQETHRRMRSTCGLRKAQLWRSYLS